jgi:hypothetical protein
LRCKIRPVADEKTVGNGSIHVYLFRIEPTKIGKNYNSPFKLFVMVMSLLMR